MKRWRSDVGSYVHERNTASEKNPNWVNELLDYYFPDNEKIDLARRKNRNNYVHEGNAETDKSPNWVNELIDYYFPDKDTIDLARGKTRINFRFWGFEQPSKKVFPRRLICGKLVG